MRKKAEKIHYANIFWLVYSTNIFSLSSSSSVILMAYLMWHGRIGIEEAKKRTDRPFVKTETHFRFFIEPYK